MKTRIGFVSNSSTSSFVAAMRPDTPTKIKVEIEVDLMDYVYTIIRTKKELDEWFQEYHHIDPEIMMQYVILCSLEKDLFVEEYEKYLEQIENGKMVLIGGFSSYGDGGNAIENMFHEKGLSKMNLQNVEMLSESGC